MSRLTELVRRVEQLNPALAKDLGSEIKTLTSRRSFGLNFERHIPETFELPNRLIRRGDKVRVRAPRGHCDDPFETRTWTVTGIAGKDEARTAYLVENQANGEVQVMERLIDDLVGVAEFRDSIFPGLKSTGKVERGEDRPYHVVINAENYHALEALLFTHEGKVDCIYIDPPYNTRDNDWKYNNDFVDKDDAYRHSKWLAMMERRLKLAKLLLNPRESVLIVTIDEKEYLRLGLLLEQIFPACKTQMISSVISPGGVSREREFTRVNEFIFFVMIGSAVPVKTTSDMLFTAHRTASENRSPIWRGLLRGGSGPLRRDSPSKFFPILVDPESLRVVRADEPLPLAQSRDTYTPPSGLTAVWPLKSGGIEGRWELSRPTFDERLAKGFVRVGGFNRENSQWTVYYLRNAEIERLKSGELIDNGMMAQGYRDISYSEEISRSLFAKTVWNEPAHDAGTYGSSMLKRLIPERKFPYPKSLYAVEDSLRFFVRDKPEAIILDFFAGSGTTAHAVARLNKQDNGRRRSIMVTNNEVSPEEAAALRQNGFRPGDPEWEAQGVCEYITKPRIEAAITGQTPEGEPIKGDYKFADEFPMSDGFEENAEFFDLTYEDPERVRFGLAFSAIAPLLWMKAGSQGRRIDAPTGNYDIADIYGVLFDIDAAAAFVKAVVGADSLRLAYIVTDDEKQYQMIADQLPQRVQPIRLYESYLRSFNLSAGED